MLIAPLHRGIVYDSAWRHWGCATTTIITDVKKSFSKVDELDGFNELLTAEQDKFRNAWEDGHVADEDIPETARKAEGDVGANEEATPEKKHAPAKQGDGGEASKPKKASRLYSQVLYLLTC